jgi:U3 small nucleolar RNA-associated protein MPP10
LEISSLHTAPHRIASHRLTEFHAAIPATMSISTTFLPALENAPHAFLQPTLPLYTDAVAYLKNILDPLAQDVSAEQHARLKESRKKRKRGESSGHDEVLRLKQIHTHGLSVDQIWEQARRVIDAAKTEAEKEVVELQNKPSAPKSTGKSVAFQENVEGEDESSGDEDLGEEGVDYQVEGIDDGEEEYEGSDDEEGELDLDEMDMHDDYDALEEGDEETQEEPAAEFVPDKFGLNDGFFSIDDFNKQSEFLEQQDVRGDGDGAASDEEDIDFDADPMAAVAGASGKAGQVEDDDEDEDGPTFGDPDAPSEDDDEEIDGGDMDTGGMGNTNDIMYADFFAPPAQKKKKNKKGRPNPHNFPEAEPAENVQEDMQRTMDAVHRDLFEESEEDEDPKDAEALDPADPRSRRSAHERRQAALAEEIRRLEAANVAKRDWQLSGEARAADRPVNALLEEDLDFERAGKPIPVITAEISESIEELIKRRILAHDFQDIIRRRPDDLATGKEGRRGKLDFELDDTKSKKGLAEEYEEEYSRRTDPNFVDVKDEKLQQEQKEIETLWRDVCGQLDSLSSWHFRPKQAAPTMDIRVDAPAVTMEDARPSAGGEVAAASQLAPQEIYKGGEAAKGAKAEVVGKSGLPAGREELDRDQKKRIRRREKERIRKANANGNAGENGAAGKKETRAKREKEMLGDLKKGNVKVIGKKGEVTDVTGREARQEGGGQGAAKYKL